MTRDVALVLTITCANQMQTILLIDDDQDFREIAVEVLSRAGYDVWDASCPESAFPMLQSEHFDLILCDLHMPYSVGERADEYVTSFEVGVRTIRELVEVFPDMPIVGLSSAAAEDIRRISRFLEPSLAWPKPKRPSELLSLVAEILDPGEGGGIH